MKIISTIAVTFLFLLDNVWTVDKKLPEYIKPCKRHDPNVSECWRNTFNSMLPNLVKGIPEIGISPVEPLLVDKISGDIGTSISLKYHAELRNTKFFGFKDAQMMNSSLNTDTWECYMDFFVPKLFQFSEYEGKGKVLVFEFDSSGTLNFNYSDVRIDFVMNGEVFNKNGNEHIKWNIPELHLKAAVRVHYEHLFPDELINEAANQAFNENIDIIFEETKPFLSGVLATIFLDKINKVYNIFPLNVLHPE